MAKDVFSKMAECPCILNEDGYLNADTDIKEIIYHPSLNVILICTNSGLVRVLDVNSGVVLHSTDLSALNQNEVTCVYIPKYDRILFSDGQSIGVRSDYNGVLLLDSILQKPVSNLKEEVRIELPLSEAIILKQSLSATANIGGHDYLILELAKVVDDAQKKSKKGIKAQKWNTVCIQVPLQDLRTATQNCVSELMLKNEHTPELSVASAVQERLSELAGEPANPDDKRSMSSEAKRRETFNHWPHMDYKWALPDQMAQAGFYHEPNKSGDDRVLCFVCSVCLVSWERTDEPWSEHERHSPNCPFVMGEYTQNVPLSVTHATNPALDATYRGANIKLLGTSNLVHLLPTANSDGLISVFDLSGKITRTHSFFVTHFDSHILERFTTDFGAPTTWSDNDEVKSPVEKRITALSIVKSPENNTASEPIRPTIMCGLNIRCKKSTLSNSSNNEESSCLMGTSDITSCLYLVVYDFLYTKETEDVDVENKSDEPWDAMFPEDKFTEENQKIIDLSVDSMDTDPSPNVNLMKHFTAFYKTLIPGESDEVFLPPMTPASPPPMPTKTVEKTHSGPRVLSVEMQNTETDSSQPSNFLVSQDYSFMNGHAMPDNTVEKSISDHISDLQKTVSAKKLNYSRAVQCICVPGQYKNRTDLEVSHIIPTPDQNYVLVVLRSLSDSVSVMLVYALDFSSKMVQLKDEVFLSRELNHGEKPVEVRLLPSLERTQGSLTEEPEEIVPDGLPEGSVVLVCADGAVRIIDIRTLRTTCLAKLKNEKFVSAAYCNKLHVINGRAHEGCKEANQHHTSSETLNHPKEEDPGIERLCACTENGSLHFYALNDLDNESVEDHEEDDLLSGLNSECPSGSTAQASESIEGPEMTKCFYDSTIISLTDLKTFNQLCSFEPLKGGFCAVVPPCWSETQQSQRIRKHLHNLKNDFDQYNKTWRLQTDTTTWDEHLFEITLPTPMTLGHVDVHFNLQASSSTPHVEMTLLRQLANGAGHTKNVTFAVDESVTIDMLQCADNPIVTKEYLKAYNAEILAGPINIASCLDLTETSGVVTFTSPKLFRSKVRTFLIHMRAVCNKEELNSKNTSKGKRTDKSSSASSLRVTVMDRLSQSGKKNDFVMGCDSIHEMSLVVYTSKHTTIAHERTVRNLMLESNAFIESLAHTAIRTPNTEVRGLVLDILTWIASVRLTRNRSSHGDAPNHQYEFLTIIEVNLSALLNHCLLLGCRNLAHRLMKLITTCSSGAKNVNEPMGNHFSVCVVNSLLTILDSITNIKSAGGLQWLIALLLEVTSKEQAHLVVAKCMSILSKISTELQSRVNPYHLLLRSRYGLYGSPLEPELFDVDPPPPPKGSPNTYYSIITGWPNYMDDFFTNYSFNKENISPKEVMSTSSDAKLKYRNIISNKIIKGLVETVPLHFNCIAASDGTRLEQADNVVTSSVASNFVPFTVSTTTAGQSTAGNKKYDIHKYLSEVVNVIEGKPFGTSEASSSNLPPKLEESFFVYLEEDMKEESHELSKIMSIVADAIQQKIRHPMKKPQLPPQTFWQTEDILSPPNQTSPSLPWQHLLMPPSQQVIIVEGMHSGARRSVTLDFGQPILLTDVIFPACSELVTLSIDVWWKGEDIDGVRLVVVYDINTKSLLLNDLTPPPICRYAKVTVVGRFGMSTSRCKIPMGYFYGNVVILPEEIPLNMKEALSHITPDEIEKHRTFLSKLFEDITCKYSLACSKLKELLQLYLVADMRNAAHLSTYMNVVKDKASSSVNAEHSKLFNAYQEAVTYQRQLNIVRKAIARIDASMNPHNSHNETVQDIANTSVDKLRTIAESLLDVLLTLDIQIEPDMDICRNLFQGLCVSQASRLQFLTATFLDKQCGHRRYWGNFLADTLTEMFATNCTEKFPQDRVFILLAFLGRRSSERSSVIDASLRVVYQTLMPLVEGRKSLLAISVDLPLLSWLFMYLSLQLDISRGNESPTRWDWVFGEMVIKSNNDNIKSGNRKKPYKRASQICQNLAHQCFITNTPSHLNNLTSSLTTKLNAALKAQELLMKKVKIKHCKMNPGDDPLKSSRLKEVVEPICERMSPRNLPLHIDIIHCLALAKALLSLILSMDHSSSSDMLLLSFKLMSRLVTMAKVKLGQLMSQEQLFSLVNFCLATKIPWAPHALACLLQDILDLASAPLTEETEMETDAAASTSWANTDFIVSDVESLCEYTIEESLLAEPLSKQGKTSSNTNNNQLPSVYESDDSDLEELIVDDFDKKSSKKSTRASAGSAQGHSSAMDCRLEMGVDSASETMLRKLVHRNSQTLLQNIANSPVHQESDEIPTPWPIMILPFQPETYTSNNKMLTICFEEMFKKLPYESTVNIEHILQLWLTLNSASKDNKFDPSVTPQIVLGMDAVNALITAIAWTPGLSLGTWCIALQTLTLVCNSNIANSGSSQFVDVSGLAACIVKHSDFVQFILRLLSGTGIVFTDKGLVGPTLCKALHDFLVRLLMRTDVVSHDSQLGSHLKTLLLDIVCQLVQPSGPIACRQGLRDAQCKLLQSMYYLDYSNADLSIVMSILEYTGNLVYSYIVNVDRLKCVNIGEKHLAMGNTFTEIFVSVLCSGSEPNKQERPVSGGVLLITLLRLVDKLVQTPFPMDRNLPEAMITDWVPASTSAATSSRQTDESKAETLKNTPPVPCLADLVLQHYSSIIRFCQCLAACKSSSLCMLANVSQKVSFTTLSEPHTVGDAVFQVLTSICKKTTKRELLLQPLIKFFSQTPQLSEPLLWFVLQVLESEEAIRNFLNAGGITILGKSFVASSSAPNTLSKVGTISAVMQHFSGTTPSSDAASSIAASSATKKSQQAAIENKWSLINFAPACSIRCLSTTAQPADILIQSGGTTHRRARTPQWSYHFYPEEVHTDLILQLPSAILLREVHLQPHLSALATCPSAVALEVSGHGQSRLVPVCPPLPTSGMTFIRLHLPIPEIVNCILIRLYKPRDANNIGLSQIRILGSSALGGHFSQNFADSAEDESHCKHSVGWLRMLHHCFTLPQDPNLTKQVIACASQVPDLLTSCCGLLLVPSHLLPVYLPCLERVLKELSLYSLESGVSTIQILLESRSSIVEPLNSCENTWQDRLLINANGYQSACELLYQICEHQDRDTSYRVGMILEWLQKITQQALSTRNMDICNPAYISCIASILWTARESNINYDLKSMISTEFFESIYNLKLHVDSNKPLKHSLDSMLCSLCYIRPELYPLLLQKIGVLVPDLYADAKPSGSHSQRGSENMTDDDKQPSEIDWYGFLTIGDLSSLILSNEQLETIALVSRSPVSIQQLLTSGLPKMLNSAILEFCSSEEKKFIPMAKLESVTAILKFFTNVCDEKIMRNWLGSPDGSSFWVYLLHWLCKKPCKRRSGLQSEARVQLEEVCVKFLSKCCLCHPSNQARLAKVLCNVIALQTNGITGFMRRLILQLLLENEKIPVSVTAEETLYKNVKLTQAHLPLHPAFRQTYNRALLYLSTNTSLSDILEQHIYFSTSYKMETSTSTRKASSTKRSLLKDSDLSMAAGVIAKDKRAKDAKNQMTVTPQLKKKRYTTSEIGSNTDVLGGRIIKCEAHSEQPLPLGLNLGQLLRMIESKGMTADWPCVHLTVCQGKGTEEKNTVPSSCPSTSSSSCSSSSSSNINNLANQQEPFSSALQVFSSMGGLALLAQHLPTVYPEAVRPTPTEKLPSEPSDSEWIKVDECDDIYEDIEESLGGASSAKTSGMISNVPPHSLTAFGLFLRLPGYADVLLKDMKKALCLLRLVLGVTDDGEGGDIFQSPIADSLPTLPFEVLRKLYDSSPLHTDEGRLLRKISINMGVVHLILACLGIFTHQTQGNTDKDGQKENKTKDDRQLYWAKGTGFGTGSTQQSWNVEQALLKQRCEEEHVTVLLHVLASYINPSEKAQEELSDDVLPPSFHDLLANSSLLSALSSYLRNDSVLDMARHIPLYRAALQLLRALAVSSQLIDLLLPQKIRDGEPSVCSLLKNMNSCVDTYASKLRQNTKGGVKFKYKLIEQAEEGEQGEGLATLMPDIQDTANLVSKVTNGFVTSDHEDESDSNVISDFCTTIEDRYTRIMKNLQFGSYDMIQELPDGGIKFVVSHHFENNAKLASEQSHPSRVKRIAQEAVTLSTSLPLSYSSSVFVRYDTSRLDIMKVLITGPAETPYANGCFELDVYFPPDYPVSPMLINLETTGHHSVRFNPNLYNDGKVCLSVLNTWHGRPEEKWNAQTSSFLQVLVSIQSLILVSEPYFNEPGYERSRGTPSGTQSSKEYNHNICQATVRWAMLEQIMNPCPCFKDVINAHFYLKRHEVIAQVEGWIKDQESDMSNTDKEKKIPRPSGKKNTLTSLDNFKKNFQQLKEHLLKLKPPSGVAEDDLPTASTDEMQVNSESPETENISETEADQQELDTYIEMEKMVNNMCE